MRLSRLRAWQSDDSQSAKVNLEDCLPAHLRSPATTITRISMGFSGAGVYRVDAGSRAYVLKVSAQSAPLDDWRRNLAIQRSAATAGISPTIVHADETHRAVVSEFIVDRSFAALYGNPQTRPRALGQLATMLRDVHELPVPDGARVANPTQLLGETLATLDAAKFAIPEFAREAAQRVLAECPPASDEAPVLSHNDVNPSNLVHDGERLLLLDWDMAAPNARHYDLATAALFFRMDAAASEQLLTAYGERTGAALPAGFLYNRRLVAVFAGLTFLDLARQRGYPGATAVDIEPVLSLGECYGRMRAGAFDIGSAGGQWSFGLALIKEESNPVVAKD